MQNEKIQRQFVFFRMQPGSDKMRRYRFKVSGRVQGVFFRKFTKQKADELGVTGWCRNTSDGESVEGEIEGTEFKIQDMMTWLRKEGSPQSVIGGSVFDLLADDSDGIYNSFDIRR